MLGITSASPITARSLMSNSEESPSFSIFSPPIPANSVSGACSFNARIKRAPNISPDGSPAIRYINILHTPRELSL